MFPVQSGCDHWSESPGIGGRFILLERMELSDESEAYTPTCDWDEELAIRMVLPPGRVLVLVGGGRVGGREALDQPRDVAALGPSRRDGRGRRPGLTTYERARMKDGGAQPSTAEIVANIDAHRDRIGVELIYRVLIELRLQDRPNMWHEWATDGRWASGEDLKVQLVDSLLRPSWPMMPLSVASLTSTGDSYDSAMAEALNNLYKWELVYPKAPGWDWTTRVRHHGLHQLGSRQRGVVIVNRPGIGDCSTS
jgi:hypothetical protein